MARGRAAAAASPSASSPALIAVAFVALWPVTAYTVGPVVLPAVALAGAAMLIIARRPVAGLAIVIALAPFVNLEVGDGRPLRLAIPALSLGLLLASLLEERERQPLAGRPLATALVALLASALVSSMLGLAPERAVSDVSLMVTAVALLLAVLRLCRGRNDLMYVVAGALCGLALAGAHGLLQAAGGTYDAFVAGADGASVGRVQGSFGHPNTYGGFLALLLPVAGAAALSRATPVPLRLVAAVSLALAGPALVLTYSRGAVGALVVGSLAWLAFVRPRAALVGGGLAVVVAVALAPASLRDRFDAGQTGGDVPLRTDIWRASIELAAERPLLGAGVGAFPDAYAGLPSSPASGGQRRLLHGVQVLVPPHAQSAYLNVLAEQGVLGAAALLALMLAALAALRRGARVLDGVGAPLSVGIGAGFTVFLSHNLLDAMLFAEAALPLVGLLGVVAVWPTLNRRDQRRPNRSPRVDPSRPDRQLGTHLGEGHDPHVAGGTRSERRSPVAGAREVDSRDGRPAARVGRETDLVARRVAVVPRDRHSSD